MGRRGEWIFTETLSIEYIPGNKEHKHNKTQSPVQKPLTSEWSYLVLKEEGVGSGKVGKKHAAPLGLALPRWKHLLFSIP